ncbi:uncharacterized protein LOC127809623 [Diospyros lotus]|uniref:uncharacterized protein LOC127809623 n=1 Tax=Diospyros lotus TaxID=55363 RepID=UPI0022557531|nr:uncharacterized protein LOC127809623 [Diospyros lotus]
MENFTALVMKLAASDPSKPLTPGRKAVIEKHLRNCFTEFRTPKHPTYAAMIYKALLGLKDDGGSTEGSISEFIRKEYDDLPWAHFTYLKHNLKKLCDSGEIVITSSNRYLLADGTMGLNSGLCSSPKPESTKQVQKHKGKKLNGRASQGRKKKVKENIQCEGEYMVVFQGQNQVHDQVIEEWNIPVEPHNNLIEELSVLQARKLDKQSILIGKQNQPEEQVMGLEHIEPNQLEDASPERPPGFEFVTVQELSKLQERPLLEGSPLLCSQQKNPKTHLETRRIPVDMPFNAEQLNEEKRCEQIYLKVPQGTPDTFLPPSTSKKPAGLATDAYLVEQEQQPMFSNQEMQIELELATTERLSRTERIISEVQHQQVLDKPQCRQLRQRPPKFEAAATITKDEWLAQSHRPGVHHYQENMQPPNRGKLQQLKQALAEESTQGEKQRSKLNSRLKLLFSFPERAKSCIDSQREPGHQTVISSSESAEGQWDKQLQKKPCRGQSQTLHPKSEATATATPLEPTQDQDKEQQHPAPKRCRRCCKSSHNSEQQHLEQTRSETRGRSPNQKPGDATSNNLLLLENQLQTYKRRGKERQQRLDKVK